MISYIKGSLEYIGDGTVFVETMGIGYKILVSPSTLSHLPPVGKDVKVFTYMNVKEDGVTLFGFSNMEELEVFNKLITVSGVGPKGALSILGSMPVSALIVAIVSDDINALSKAQGIGKKTAQRLVIELRDKFKNEDLVKNVENVFGESIDFDVNNSKAEALEVLLTLGYSRSEAVKAISSIDATGMDTQTILKNALKKMVR